jgi:hypothetical protein
MQANHAVSIQAHYAKPLIGLKLTRFDMDLIERNGRHLPITSPTQSVIAALLSIGQISIPILGHQWRLRKHCRWLQIEAYIEHIFAETVEEDFLTKEGSTFFFTLC